MNKSQRPIILETKNASALPSCCVALSAVVKAWEVLPPGNHSSEEVARWLLNDMKPAIDAARKELSET